MKSSEVEASHRRLAAEAEGKSSPAEVDSKSGVGGVIVEGMAPDPKEVRIRQSGVGEPG